MHKQAHAPDTGPMDQSAGIGDRVRYCRRIHRASASLLLGCALLVLTSCATPSATVAVSPPPTATTPSPTASSSSPTEPAPTDSPIPIPTDPALPDPSPTAQGDTKVTIVNSGADGRVISASGLVTGATGSDGVCTLTATSEGLTLSGQIDAQSTPAAVNCGLIEITAPTGRWTMTLTYRVGTSATVSEPVTVDQP